MTRYLFIICSLLFGISFSTVSSDHDEAVTVVFHALQDRLRYYVGRSDKMAPYRAVLGSFRLDEKSEPHTIKEEFKAFRDRLSLESYSDFDWELQNQLNRYKDNGIHLVDIDFDGQQDLISFGSFGKGECTFFTTYSVKGWSLEWQEFFGKNTKNRPSLSCYSESKKDIFAISISERIYIMTVDDKKLKMLSITDSGRIILIAEFTLQGDLLEKRDSTGSRKYTFQ